MVRAVKRVNPEMIFHLGDGWRDAEALAAQYPGIPFYQVPGNCDFRFQSEPEQLLTIQGKRIFLCHGHNHGVKQSFREADALVEAEQLDAFLFGHTHTPLVEMRGPALFFNPGSIGLGYPPSFGVLTVEPEKVNGRIFQLPTGFGRRRFR